MKITGIEVIPFETFVDRFSNGDVYPKQKVIQTLTKVTTAEGIDGYFFGGHFHGDQEGLLATDRALITQLIGPMLSGQDPMEREKIWQWLLATKIPENIMSAIDLALWDLAGRVAGLPVHHLLGGARDKVKTYASTYNNLGSPEEYAAYALECKNLGYTAYKIHSNYYWDPATRQAAPPRPSHVEWDIKACYAVREAVGDEMVLMYDPWGTYNTYADAVRVGRVLEELNFYWYEHPMPEHKVASYIKLAEELTIPICSPEIAEGGLFTRADWISRQASDISRIDVLRGGITGAMKTAAVAEAYGVRCEPHMSGFGNLQVLGATSEDVCEYYERGLLAPGVDYDATPGYLKAPCDAMDSEGFVTVPTGPGLGYDIVWDYIDDHRVAEAEIACVFP